MSNITRGGSGKISTSSRNHNVKCFSFVTKTVRMFGLKGLRNFTKTTVLNSREGRRPIGLYPSQEGWKRVKEGNSKEQTNTQQCVAMKIATSAVPDRLLDAQPTDAHTCEASICSELQRGLPSEVLKERTTATSIFAKTERR